MIVYGRREGYYTDNREDALVMWSRSLREETYWRELEELRKRLGHRLADVDIPELLPSHRGWLGDNATLADGDMATS
jgi:hypothetical protein